MALKNNEFYSTTLQMTNPTIAYNKMVFEEQRILLNYATKYKTVVLYFPSFTFKHNSLVLFFPSISNGYQIWVIELLNAWLNCLVLTIMSFYISFHCRY